jgi:plasmid stability protein
MSTNNPCTACQDRARLRRQLEETVSRHLRSMESLHRDILTATSDELPGLQADVERLSSHNDRAEANPA